MKFERQLKKGVERMNKEQELKEEIEIFFNKIIKDINQKGLSASKIICFKNKIIKKIEELKK